jgi:hypothetical protein
MPAPLNPDPGQSGSVRCDTPRHDGARGEVWNEGGGKSIDLADPTGATYVLFGTLLSNAAIVLWSFPSNIAAVIAGALNGTPGIPFRRGAARNANPGQIRVVGAGAVVIAMVFFVQAAARVTDAAPADSQVVAPPGLVITVASAVLAVSQLAVGFLCIFRARAWSRALSLRAGEVDRPQGVLSPRRFVVVGCGCLALIVPSLVVVATSM